MKLKNPMPDSLQPVSVAEQRKRLRRIVRGHQILKRNPRLQNTLAARLTGVSEEILASLLGSLIADEYEDRVTLYYKAIVEASEWGVESRRLVPLIDNLRNLLEKAL